MCYTALWFPILAIVIITCRFPIFAVRCCLITPSSYDMSNPVIYVSPVDITKIMSSTATHANSIQKNPTTMSLITDPIGRLFSSSTNIFLTALYIITMTEPIATNGSPILTSTITTCSNLFVASCGVLALTFTSDSIMSPGFHPLIFESPTFIATASVGTVAAVTVPMSANAPIMAKTADRIALVVSFIWFPSHDNEVGWKLLSTYS